MLNTRDWAVITGATSGIGQAFTVTLAKRGINLIMTGRNGQELAKRATLLEKDYGVKTIIYAGDLTEPEQLQGLVAACSQAKVRIKYLINNAGFGLKGNFLKNDWRQEQAMITLNVSSLTYLAKTIGAMMAKRRDGYIVNVASTAAFLPGPNMAVYYASKAYVLSLSLAINQELKDRGVSVMALCPGPTATSFAKTALAERSSLFRGRLLDAEKVAEYGYKAMLKRKSVAVYGPRNRILIGLSRFVPRNLAARIVHRAQA